jgi:hypothetical protein
MMADLGQPDVLGPIGGARPPWGTPRVESLPDGYVVEEFQLLGVAGCYQRRAGEPLATADVEMVGSASYHTRLLVVRPADPATFNHTVLLNWQNVSAGFEQSAPSRGEPYEGYAWVGVSAQEVGLYGPSLGMRGGARNARGLVDEDPERYDMLRHPGDPGSFDIFADAARVVGPGRSTTVDPLAGFDVEKVIATGASQSAMRLVAYANALHRRQQVVDGYALTVWEGQAPDLLDGPIAVGSRRTAIRDDLGVPVVVVNSEFEAVPLHLVGAVDSEWIRYWEVAGTPHGATTRSRSPNDRGWQPNLLRFAPVADSAIRHVRRWVHDARPAPRQPRIEIDAGPRSSVRRDRRGNAVGGIRLPELQAPVAEYRGNGAGTGMPSLYGASRRFSDQDLRSMYPDRRVFEDRWRAAVDHLVSSEALRPEDAPGMIGRMNDVELPDPLGG